MLALSVTVDTDIFFWCRMGCYMYGKLGTLMFREICVPEIKETFRGAEVTRSRK
jgi:predicted metal-binding protein